MNYTIKKTLWYLFPLAYRYSRRTTISSSDSHPKIIGVYHIFCVNDWDGLVRMQISSLRDSGLLAETSKLYVTCITSDNKDLDIIKEIIGSKCEIVEVSSDPHRYEFPAIDFIARKSKDEDFLVYYFHTKGISYQRCHVADYPNGDFERLKYCAEKWRKMMEYFNFNNWRTAVDVLAEYDTYGCYHFDVPTPNVRHKFYSGNFWWSKSSYLRTIPAIEPHQYQNRYWAENWLCLATNKAYSMFDTSAELYAVPIESSLYDMEERCSFRTLLIFHLKHFSFLVKKMKKNVR